MDRRMKQSLNEEITLEFSVIYSKRKTLAIKINSSGEVCVAAPYRTSEQVILDMINKKADWIIKKLNEIAEINKHSIEKKFIDGEQFMYQGGNYPLQQRMNENLAKPVVKLCCGRLMIDTPSAEEDVIKNAIEKWYRSMADVYIKSRLQYYQSIINVTPNKITIKNQKSRWGSCSSKGNLNFNWRIIMAPSNVLDYLVIHELCHLIHPNHSKTYWELVAEVMPDYKEKKNWLKKNGARLHM